MVRVNLKDNNGNYLFIDDVVYFSSDGQGIDRSVSGRGILKWDNKALAFIIETLDRNEKIVPFEFISACVPFGITKIAPYPIYKYCKENNIEYSLYKIFHERKPLLLIDNNNEPLYLGDKVHVFVDGIGELKGELLIDENGRVFTKDADRDLEMSLTLEDHIIKGE